MIDFISSIYSDTTAGFLFPENPKTGDTVTVKLRVMKDSCERVTLIFDQTEIPFLMKKYDSNETFDRYEASFVCPENRISYCFLLTSEGVHYRYQRSGLTVVSDPYIATNNFLVIPNFNIPKWAKGCVGYQIFTDRFCNGEPTNDVCNNEYYYAVGHAKHQEDWNATPSDTDIRMFYGGDLQGVCQKLDYLQGLGVEMIYLNPIFVSPSSHKYDTQDYAHIDPHLAIIKDDNEHQMQSWEKNNGYAPRYIKRVTSQINLEESDKYFASLCDEIHSRGMKIVLDGVFNHCGSFNKWMDREGIYRDKFGYKPGAYGNPDSPYRNYFNFADHSRSNMPEYEGWWGFTTLPKLNYEGSLDLCEEIFEIAEKWTSAPYNIDGWRLDVAADLGKNKVFNHQFWKTFRKRVKAINPNLLIIAEHYGDPSDWLNGDQWDSVMNYDAFMEPITYFFTGMEKHSDSKRDDLYNNAEEFFKTVKEKSAILGAQPMSCAMNQLSNHDHSRFLTRTNRMVGRLESAGADAATMNINKGIFREAVCFLMTWPGMPTVYYADEAGQVGWTDPDCRRTYPWGREDADLLELHKKLGTLRNSYTVLKSGSMIGLCMDTGILGYARFDQSSCVVTVCNNNADARTICIPVSPAEVEDGETMTRHILTREDGCDFTPLEAVVKDGQFEITLDRHSACIWCIKR